MMFSKLNVYSFPQQTFIRQHIGDKKWVQGQCFYKHFMGDSLESLTSWEDTPNCPSHLKPGILGNLSKQLTQILKLLQGAEALVGSWRTLWTAYEPGMNRPWWFGQDPRVSCKSELNVGQEWPLGRSWEHEHWVEVGFKRWGRDSLYFFCIV